MKSQLNAATEGFRPQPPIIAHDDDKVFVTFYSGQTDHLLCVSIDGPNPRDPYEFYIPPCAALQLAARLLYMSKIVVDEKGQKACAESGWNFGELEKLVIAHISAIPV